MIGGERRAGRQNVADGSDVFAEVAEALFGADAAFIERARAIVQHAGLQVHLEERQAHFPALAHALGVDLGIRVAGGIGVDANAIVVLIADQAVGGDAVNLAGNIVEGHIDRAVAAAHAAVVGELAQRPQVAFDVQRVLA